VAVAVLARVALPLPAVAVAVLVRVASPLPAVAVAVLVRVALPLPAVAVAVLAQVAVALQISAQALSLLLSSTHYTFQLPFSFPLAEVIAHSSNPLIKHLLASFQCELSFLQGESLIQEADPPLEPNPIHYFRKLILKLRSKL
jgi:glycerol uptake facilitator-like aquaporin